MKPAVKGALAWTVAIVPLWIVLILCTHWEPVAHDGWHHWVWHRFTGLSLGHLYDFCEFSYEHNNPRLGQLFTLLVYTPGPWHAIVTPIVELALFYLLASLVLGRWACPKRAEDALLFATIFAMAALTVPSFGMMLFYRPYTGNYLYGLVINLLLLVPYRFHYARDTHAPARANLWRAPLMLVLGFTAGLCNEHTGPALAAVIALALFAFWRRGERLVSLAWGVAGLVGLVAGGMALFLAPGQSERYNGLANHQGTLGRIVERGVAGNGRIVVIAILYLTPLVIWLGLGLVARLASRSARVAAAAAPRDQLVTRFVGAGMSLAITMTLFASPKQGPRLYLATVLIACTVLAGWFVAQCVSRWARAVAATLAAVVLAYMSWRCVSTYRTLGSEYRERVAILEAAPDNGVADIPIYTIHRSRWSVGDDLLIEQVRNRVSYSFGLALVRMHYPGHLDDMVTPVPPPDEP